MAANQDYAGPGGVQPGGHYRMAFKTGLTTTITGGGSIFAFRWTLANYFARMKQIRVGAGINTAFGTAQISDLALFRATAWTTAPTAGGTVTQPTQLDNMMADVGAASTMMPVSTFFPVIANNIAVSSTGALTTGSPTVDANASAYDVLNIIALGSADRITLYDASFGIDYAMTFGVNEGFLIQIPTTQGATGKVVYYISLVFAVNNTPF